MYDSTIDRWDTHHKKRMTNTYDTLTINVPHTRHHREAPFEWDQFLYSPHIRNEGKFNLAPG